MNHFNYLTFEQSIGVPIIEGFLNKEMGNLKAKQNEMNKHIHTRVRVEWIYSNSKVIGIEKKQT